MRGFKDIIIGLIVFIVLLFALSNIGQRSEGVKVSNKSVKTADINKILSDTVLGQSKTATIVRQINSARDSKQVQMALNAAGVNLGDIDKQLDAQAKKVLSNLKQSKTKSTSDVVDETMATESKPIQEA